MPDEQLVDDERAQDHLLHGAAVEVAGQLGVPRDLGGLGAAGQRRDLVAVVGAEPVPREHPLRVGQRHRRGAEQRAQVTDAALRARLGEALAQRWPGERSLVQGPEGRPVRLGPEVGPTEHPSERRRHARTVTGWHLVNKGSRRPVSH